MAMTRDDTWEPPPIPGWAWVRLRNVDGVSRVEPIGAAVLA